MSLHDFLVPAHPDDTEVSGWGQLTGRRSDVGLDAQFHQDRVTSLLELNCGDLIRLVTLAETGELFEEGLLVDGLSGLRVGLAGFASFPLELLLLLARLLPGSLESGFPSSSHDRGRSNRMSRGSAPGSSRVWVAVNRRRSARTGAWRR